MEVEARVLAVQPVLDAQRAFRALLAALAEPARAVPVETAETAPGLYPSTAAVVAALVDVDTPLWLSSGDAALAEWIAFRTGAPMADVSDAAFALVRRGDAWPALDALAQGTAEYPDRSATLIVEVDGFEGERRRFGGPGFERPRALALLPWPADFDAAWRANRERFPLGVDLVLASPNHIAGLPRSALLEAC